MAEDFIPDTSSDFIPDTPAAGPRTLPPPPNMSSMPPLNSQWDATKYGVGQAAGGFADVMKGFGSMMVTPPQSKTEKYLTMIPGGVQMKRMLEGAAPSGVTQVPGAIKDLMDAPDAISQLAAVAPRAGGQGLGTMALAKGASMLNDIPSFGKAKANYKIAEAANKVPLDTQPLVKAAMDVRDLAQSGGQEPKVIRDFLRRMNNPNKPPLDYEAARKFYSNASRLSANEYQTYNPTTQRALGDFTRQLGDSIQSAANQAGVGPEHSTAMTEYRRASQFKKTTSNARATIAESALKGAGLGVGGAIGGYIFSKLAGK